MSSPASSFSKSCLLAATLFSTLLTPSLGLQVTPGSACASYCLDDGAGDPHDPNDSTTTASDVVCANADFFSTSAGTKYRTCINCLQNSTAVNGTESDTAWYLYNLRYTVDVCLFSYPSVDAKNTSLSSPCDLPSNCEPLRTALTSNLHAAHNGTDLGYCTADSSAFQGSSVDDCMQCLQTEPQQTYLANFLTALSAGCAQQPSAGHVLGLNSTLFAATPVGIITPAWNQTAPAKAASVSALNTGTIVGLSIGIALLFLGALAIFLYWRRQQRRMMDGDGLADFPHKRSPSQADSISSSSSSRGGFYPTTTTNTTTTTDYKTQHSIIDHDQIEMYNRIKAQQHQHQHQHPRLDGVPIHPAFVPRSSFSRPSRGLAPLAMAERPIKAYKPDEYVESLAARHHSHPAAAAATAAAAAAAAAQQQQQQQRPAPAPPRMAARTTPSLVLPSLSRVRAPKTYIPPPIIVIDPPSSRSYTPAESGMP